MDSRLAGKSVLITGAARGIGYCTAAEFARAGSVLVVTDRNAAQLEEASGKLRGLGATVHPFAVDVADRPAVERMADEVLERLGGLDVLINNAGVGYLGDLADTTLERWQQLMDVNFWGPLYHVYAFLPSMRQRRAGHIVNVSSGQAFFRLPSWGAYSIAKLAVGAFSELLSYEVARDNVQVTTVYPYMVNTGFYQGIEGTTWLAKLSMKLVPYYSDKPEKVGRLIFDAVRKKKRVEMVNVINDIGYYSRLIPYMSGAVARVSTWLLTGGEVHPPAPASSANGHANAAGNGAA